ncbi:MAG: hypothetical protein Q4G46_05760 [Propionibacteriaceae bacterium]|nr:hypothetical protein [Propionibacteriaceae bacterium]
MSLAEQLRAIPSLTGTAPALDLTQLPADPTALFREWLEVALRHGVREPHAVSLATVDADGVPDARTLILKDVDHGCHRVFRPRPSLTKARIRLSTTVDWGSRKCDVAWSRGLHNDFVSV